MLKKKNHNYIAVIVLVLFWQVLSMALNREFIPSPLESLKGLAGIISEKELIPNFLISLYRIVISGVVSLVLALPLGILMGRNESVDKIVMPFVSILYPLPKIVFLPVFIVFLGLGNAPKILIISLIVFFQILVIIRDAVKKISKDYIFSFETLSDSRMALYRHVILPAIAGDIITAMRISVGSAVAVLFFAETFASQNGLGYIILDTMESRNYAQMYGAIIAMSFLGIGIYEFLTLIEKRALKWKKD